MRRLGSSHSQASKITSWAISTASLRRGFMTWDSMAAIMSGVKTSEAMWVALGFGGDLAISDSGGERRG